jgi:hypothetical protein
MPFGTFWKAFLATLLSWGTCVAFAGDPPDRYHNAPWTTGGKQAVEALAMKAINARMPKGSDCKMIDYDMAVSSPQIEPNVTFTSYPYRVECFDQRIGIRSGYAEFNIWSRQEGRGSPLWTYKIDKLRVYSR